MTTVETQTSSLTDRRGQLPDIIDVDSFDDDIAARPSQRRRVERDVITILDSDEEEGSSAGPSRLQAGPSNNRRFTSLPPPPQNNAVPPMPLLPQHLHPLRSYPMRRHPPPHPSGIVRPSAQPLPFEAHLGRREVDHSPPLPPLRAAPPSHHRPSMGLGGALVSLHQADPRRGHGHNNHGHAHAARPQRRARADAWGLPSFGSFFSLSAPSMTRQRQTPPMAVDEDDFFALFGGPAEFDDGYNGGRPFFMQSNAHRVRHIEPDYKPAFTHPGHPAHGFTFDFAPPTNDMLSSSSPVIVDGSSGPSAGGSGAHIDESNTILICTQCMDPLVTGESNTGDEQTRRRLWALRCGHMLDGKCIEELMKPLLVLDAQGEFSEAELPRGDKGKGKAAPVENGDDPLNLVSNTIRSRLRSRGNDSTRPTRPLPSRAKGKGKVQAPVVEAEYQWNCPVAGCERMHSSVKIGGKWTADDKNGAIAMYV